MTAGATTLVMKDMHDWSSTSFSRTSIWIKIIIFLYILGVALYCAVGALVEETPSNDDDTHLVIIEWNLTIGGMLWLFSFVLDWKDVFVTLRGDFSKTVKMV